MNPIQRGKLDGLIEDVEAYKRLEERILRALGPVTEEEPEKGGVTKEVRRKTKKGKKAKPGCAECGSKGWKHKKGCGDAGSKEEEKGHAPKMWMCTELEHRFEAREKPEACPMCRCRTVVQV